MIAYADVIFGLQKKADGTDSEATQVLFSAATWLRKVEGHPEEEEEEEES